VEIQGAAERDSFSAEDYTKLVALASDGMKSLFALQREALARAQQP
jgi:ribonuclease PH